MRHIAVIIYLLTSYGLCSQELKLSGAIGYSITETDQTKKIALYNGANIGAEFRFGQRWNIIFFAGGFRLRYEHTNTQGASLFYTRYFLQLPVQLRKYYGLSATSMLFMDVGIAPSYQFSAKMEILDIQTTRVVREKDLGFNFSGLFAFGLRTSISKRLFFETGLATHQDFFYAYKNEADKTKTKRNQLYIAFSRIPKQ